MGKIILKNKIINKVYKILSVFSILITISIIYVYYMFLMERQIWQHISVILLFITQLIIDCILYSRINKKTTIIYLIIQALLGLGTMYTSICLNTIYSFIFTIIFIIVIICPKTILQAVIKKDKKIIMTISKELSLLSFSLYYITSYYDYLIIKVFGIILLLMLAIALYISFYDKNKIFLISTIVIQTSATISLLMINNRNIVLDFLFFIIVFLTMLIFENTKKNENY